VTGTVLPDPDGWEAAEAALRAARVHVGWQITEQLLDERYAGSRGLLARRVKGVMEAEHTGDAVLLRAAVMEVAVAAAAWAAALDLDPRTAGR
jgi:hypothetical protein